MGRKPTTPLLPILSTGKRKQNRQLLRLDGTDHVLTHALSLCPFSLPLPPFNSLGNLARNRGQYVQARDYYDKAIAMDRHVSGDNVRNENHAKTILNRGNMAMKLGRLKEAKGFLEEALAMFYHLYGGEAANNCDIAVVLCSLANLFKSQKEYDKSEEHYMKALAMQYQLFGKDAKNANIAETLHNIGILQRDRRRFDMAKVYHEQALQMMVGTMGNDSSKHPLVHKIAHELIKIEQTASKVPGKCWVPTLGRAGRKKEYSPGKYF